MTTTEGPPERGPYRHDRRLAATVLAAALLIGCVQTEPAGLVTGGVPPQRETGPSHGYELDTPVDVLSVTDGDTFDIRVDNRRESVRIKGVDTPELRGPEPYAEEARDYTWRKLGQQVELEFDSGCPQPPLEKCRDKYNRILAYVRRMDGEDHGAELLRLGLAEVYVFARERFDRVDPYRAIESEAKRARLGVWGQ